MTRISRHRLRLSITGVAPLLAAAALMSCSDQEADSPVNWPVYLGDSASSQFSSLDQINRENVSQLEAAWTYSSGDRSEDDRSQIQCNPLIIDGRLYGTSPIGKAFALNAENGQLLWSFDPQAQGDPGALGVNRGLVYLGLDEEERIYYSAGHSLFALNARTGEVVPSFGQEGQVDLRKGLDTEDFESLSVSATTPPALFKDPDRAKADDLLVIGSRVGEGPSLAAPGHIRAIDAKTGEFRWIFRTVPRPGEAGYETWPDGAWKYTGGANSWAGMAVDAERGLVFVPTGSPSFDFWGGNRKGQNLFGNCLLALDVTTGNLKWYFQAVHHDIWDRDLPAPPNLVTVTHEGRRVDAVAQITKTGLVFLLDRDTGQPLFPVEERPAPASDLPGEESWPTQPVPVKPPPFSRQTFTEADATDLSPEARSAVLQRLREVRSDHMFEPPSTQGTLVFPGFDGGGEWGGAAFEPSSGRLFVNSNEMPWILTMVSLEERLQRRASRGAQVYGIHCAVCHGQNREGNTNTNNPPLPVDKVYEPDATRDIITRGKGRMLPMPQLSEREVEAVLRFLSGQGAPDRPARPSPVPGIPYTHTGYNRFFDPEGYPAIKPPWGQLTSIDLNSGEIVWQRPLGEFEELTKRGIPPTGTENYGGPIVTAGGILFIGGTQDEKFRAFDTETGEVLWETALPAGGYATPATYSAGGRQFVVIAAGGGKMGTASGDSYIAFALPLDGR